jgi:Tol biopolymer transport system component
VPLSGPRFSPDGARIAFANRGEVAVVDVGRGISTPVTDLPGNQGGPIWSPDGARLAFVSRGGEAIQLATAPVAGGSAPTRLVAGRRLMFPSDWSRDGATIAYTLWPDDATQRTEVWAYSFAEGAPRLLLSHSNASVAAARFSPDGRWIAYQSDESGRWEVYVRPYPGPGQPVRVSQAGGVQPVWRADGRELFFAGPDFQVMAATRAPDGRFAAGPPTPLVTTAVTSYWTIEAQFSLDASPDGQRFVLANDDSSAPVRSLTLIQNWPALLARRP